MEAGSGGLGGPSESGPSDRGLCRRPLPTRLTRSGSGWGPMPALQVAWGLWGGRARAPARGSGPAGSRQLPAELAGVLRKLMGRGRPAAAAGSPNSSWQPAAPPQRTCTPLDDRPDRGDKADRHHTAAGSRASGRRRVRALLLLSAQRAGCLVIDPVSTTPAKRESAVPARGWRARRWRSTAAAHAPRPAASCPPQVTLSAGRGHKWSSRAAQACGLHSCCRSGVAALRPVAVYCRYVPYPATHRTSGRPLLSRWQLCLLARLRQGVQDTDALVAMLGVVRASPHSEASHATGQAADASWRARPIWRPMHVPATPTSYGLCLL